MFPLNTVVFPGMSVPLHVFEDRYRTLVRHLLRSEDPAQRVFGTVAIREGYEVGDHGAQSVYRVGCVLQLTEVDRHDDGTFDIVAVGRERLDLEEMDSAGSDTRRATSTCSPSRRSTCRPRCSSAPAPPSPRTAWR